MLGGCDRFCAVRPAKMRNGGAMPPGQLSRDDRRVTVRVAA
jgi:hypothetical protein